MLVILATQEAEIRRITVQNHPRRIVPKTLSQKKTFTEWLKIKALSSYPSTAKNKTKKTVLPKKKKKVIF
jgi:hypothetical protein